MPHSIVNQIMAALERATDVHLHHNRIDISDGEVIRLEGEVDNIVTKRRAFQIAREVAHPTPVEDRLLLRVQQQPDGDELLQSVIDALMTEPAFRDYSINAQSDTADAQHTNYGFAVMVENSRVRLDGLASSPSHRRLAEVITWWIPGTADVENRIRVQPPRQDNDEEITEIIRLVFDKDPTLDAENIQVLTQDRQVTLRGTVNSEVNRRMAGYDCWYIPGVHQVHNELQVHKHQ